MEKFFATGIAGQMSRRCSDCCSHPHWNSCLQKQHHDSFRAMQQLNSMIQKYPTNKVLITSSHDPKQQLQIPAFAIAALTEQQIEHFLQKQQKFSL